jgi:hypothetical protein
LSVESTLHGYWLLNDALANVVNLCVKLTNEGLELEILLSSIPPSQFNAKLILLTNRMQLEVTCVLTPFGLYASI